MCDLIITFEGLEGTCELTTEMDAYLVGERPDWYHTYMYDFSERTGNMRGCDGKNGHIYVMRTPGATRGCIYTNSEGNIETITFYEDVCYGKLKIYRPEMENIKSKYIGRKVVCKYN